VWHRNRLSSAFHPAYRRLLAPARRSALLAHALFGIHRLPRRDVLLWDWVTLALRRALRDLSLEDAAFLDLGCGYAAVLSFLAHQRGCRAITAADVNADCVASAGEFLRANGVPAAVKLSDMASGLGGKRFDVIAFNSPYIPHEWGWEQGLDRAVPPDARPTTAGWSGGPDGMRGIERFLRGMPPHLAAGGFMLLGFNRFYVEEAGVADLVDSLGLVVTGALRPRPFRATVLTIRARDGGIDA